MQMHFQKSAEGNWPANALFEYVLAGHPDNGVNTRIMEEKASFSETYGKTLPLTASPNITVASFFASEAMEPTIIRWMQRIFGAQPSFSVTLNNYSGFPPDTIFLRVQDPQPFQLIRKKLQPVDEFIRASDCPPLKLHTRPHLSIAQQLPEQVYNKAMADYARKIFHASFRIEELLLLRRSNPFDHCKTVQIFRLLPVGNDEYSCVA